MIHKSFTRLVEGLCRWLSQYVQWLLRFHLNSLFHQLHLGGILYSLFSVLYVLSSVKRVAQHPTMIFSKFGKCFKLMHTTCHIPVSLFHSMMTWKGEGWRRKWKGRRGRAGRNNLTWEDSFLCLSLIFYLSLFKWK